MPITQDLFSTIRSEGALLPPDLLRRVLDTDSTLPGLAATSYHLVEGEKLTEAVNRSWTRLQGVWRAFCDQAAKLPEADVGTSLTRERWLLTLFTELGYGRLPLARGLSTGSQDYPISHLWHHTPIHLVGYRVLLDRRAAGVAGAARVSPHGLVQEFLNRSESHLWGFVSNGLKLRVLRDSAALVRQSFLEFDLEGMFDGQAYADFVVLWLVCHQSRVEADTPAECWLEQWSRTAEEQGTRALDRLRAGVQEAITQLGQGLLAQRGNAALRDALADGTLTARDYYRELLRVVYRMLFLCVAEEKELLFAPGTPEDARARYRQYYSIARLRRLADRRPGTPHVDLWRGLRLVWERVRAETGCPELGLPPLNGFLWSAEATAHLNDANLPNVALLEAVRALAFTVDGDVRRAVNFRSLGPEELGSVYESLLELHPELNADAGTFMLVEAGTERRATGSHYTPTPILQRVLDFALTPQIERSLAAPDPAAALLAVRILDPACGSGHFLIAAGHRVARALATIRTGELEPAPDEVHHALRDVVARCLYGVDYNPMAVELCKVALWLETFEPGKPLSFLDHHIRCGNSLIGVPSGATVARNRAAVEAQRAELQHLIERSRLESLNLSDLQAATAAATRAKKLTKERDACVYDSWAGAIPDEAFAAVGDDDREVARKAAAENKKARRTGQREIGFGAITVTLPDELVACLDAIGAGAEGSVAEVTSRAAQYEEATRHIAYQQAMDLANTWTAAWFWPLRPGEPEPPTQGLFLTLQGQPEGLSAAVAARVAQEAAERRFFHYELAFPEVFTTARGGFDLVLGNPPYLGGMKISTTYGDKVLHFLKANHAEQTGGRADLAAYFVRRCFDLLRPAGNLCFITTNSIAQGDTRDAGLAPIVRRWGGEIANAVRSVPWEGEAVVHVAILHLHRGPWRGRRTLDGLAVERITADLTTGEDAEPRELAANEGIAFAATNILGEGFHLTAGERDALLVEATRNAEVIKPLMGGAEAMRLPTLEPDRWVIDFGDLPLDAAATYEAPMRLVRERVKPQRDRVKRAAYRERWWRFGERAANLYATIAERRLSRVIAIPEVSKVMLPVFLDTGMVYAHTLFIFADDSWQLFGELTSAFHWLWAATRCTSMRMDPRYNPSLCFLTFPRPAPSAVVAGAARSLHDARADMMRLRGLGITRLYNLVTDPANADADVQQLRGLHAALDAAVAASYGWADLVPTFGHSHYPTQRFGVRWTVLPEVQREIERRLLTLNLERAAAGGIAVRTQDLDEEPEAIGAT